MKTEEKDILKIAREPWGVGWNLLTDRQKQAEVAKVLCNVIVTNDQNEGYERAAKLIDAMFEELREVEKFE